MANYQIILTAKNVESCPLYTNGEQIFINMPEVDLSSSEKICTFLLAELLKKKLLKEKKFTCELGENFNSKSEYASEFECDTSLTLLCPRINSQVSFSISIEEKSDNFSILKSQKFKGIEDKKLLLSQLKEIQILSGVSPELLFGCLGEIRIRKYNQGDVIINKGGIGHNFYILYKGEVEIVNPLSNGMESVIGQLKEGECFGEMSLLTGEPISATVRACKESTLLLITKCTFKKLIENTPVMSLMFTKLLSQRLKDTTQRMSLIIASGIIGRLKTLPLPELIQTLAITECDGILFFTSKNQKAKIFFLQGHVINVILKEGTKSIEGEEAFYALLKWNDGNFRFEKKDIKVEKNVFLDSMGLLLEGMRRIDEEKVTKK